MSSFRGRGRAGARLARHGHVGKGMAVATSRPMQAAISHAQRSRLWPSRKVVHNRRAGCTGRCGQPHSPAVYIPGASYGWRSGRSVCRPGLRRAVCRARARRNPPLFRRTPESVLCGLPPVAGRDSGGTAIELAATLVDRLPSERIEAAGVQPALPGKQDQSVVHELPVGIGQRLG